MMIIYAAIYRLAIGAYALAIRVASLFNNKAKLFIDGRKDLLQKIEQALAGEIRPRIWMHCSSLGEFEQGRPVLEALRIQYPGYAIILTFFSPSGYEVRKNYEGADHIFYLPIDTSAHARRFLDVVKPSLCLFVKYEFWYYYLSNIAARHIPLILISAVFRKDQVFFKWYGGLQRSILKCFSHLFVQDADSVQLLQSISITNVSVIGDTRFDRVIEAVSEHTDLPIVTSFSEGHKILVAGSTWKEDEEMLHKALSLLPKDWKLILVPHEVDSPHIAAIEKRYTGHIIKWSQWREGTDARVLLVDKVGLLLKLYRYGHAAWIGGGFGKEGVHNVLEAAVYGIPCFYGPIFHQFIEATALIEKGGAFTISTPADLATSLEELDDAIRYEQHATAAKGYVFSGEGATAKVIDYIGKFNL
jgi:3-deoxy-D-manno-octulosonic-acid transferase